MPTELFTLLGQFGPMGIFIAYLMWDSTRKSDARQQIDKERTESDKALAASLSALTVTIQHLASRIDK